MFKLLSKIVGSVKPDAVVVNTKSLSPEALETFKEIMKTSKTEIIMPPLGDGNAVFFGEPDEKEELEYERELEGTLPWYKRILR